MENKIPTYEEILNENISLKRELELKNTSEDILKSLSEAVPDALFLIDKEGNYLDYIPSKEFDSYVPPEVFLGKNMKEIMSKDLCDIFSNNINLLFETNKTQSCEYQLLGKDYEARFIKSPKEKIVVIIRDITKNKKILLDLKKAEEKFRLSFENSPQGMTFLSLDGKFLKVNKKICEITGYSQKELLSMDFQEITHPEDIEKNLDYLIKLKNGELESFEIEKRCISKDKKIIWVIISVSILKEVNKDESFFICQVIDITERKNIEQKSKENEEKFIDLFNSSPDLLILSDLETGRILDVNERFLNRTNHVKKEIIGKTSLDIKLWPSKELRNNYTSSLQKNGFVKNQEYPFLLKSGEKREALISANIININNNNCILATLRDITDEKNIQKKLNDERIMLKTIIETIPDHIFLKDINGIYIYCNKRVEKLFQEKEENIIGKTDFDFVSKDIAESFKESDQIVISTNKPYKNTEWIEYKNGEKELIETIKTPMCDSLGKIIGVLGVARDITEIHKTQQELFDREELYSTIVNQAVDSIALVDVKTAKFYQFNESCYKSLGYSKEEFEKLTIGDINSDHSPEYIKENIAFLIKNNGGIFETKHRCKNGNVRDVRVSTRLIKLKNKNYLTAIWSDITEIKNIELNLRKSESKLKEAQKLAKLGHWELDVKTGNLSWSDEIFEIFQIDPLKFEASYDSFLNTIHPEDRENVNKSYTDSVKNKNSYDIVHRLLMKDGSIKYVHEMGKTDYDEIGNPLVSIGTVQDITDRVEIENEIRELNQTLEEKVRERTEQLEIANKDLESFAYSVSHDLRTPLRHIDGFSKILKNSIKNPTSDTEKYISKIYESVSKMSNMIEDLLKFSRLGRKQLEVVNVNLNEIVKSVIEQLKPDTENRNIEFKLNTLSVVKGDASLLQMVFENLISNAIKFTSKKDKAVIEIGECYKNEAKYVYVKDNGAGFDMSYADKLFGVFQRLHTEKEFSGTGIGLANVKQIIQKHGGSIFAESQVNQGTTFYIFLKGNKNYDN